MTTPAYLVRLLAYTSLSRALRLGPEDDLCVRFANRMRAAALDGQLRAIFVHVPNQLANGHRTGVKAAIARAMGMHVGSPDYLFLWIGGCLALEAKAPEGRQSPGQKDFESWCRLNEVPYEIFRTLDEAEAILRRHGVLA